MGQAKALTLQEALIYVERTTTDTLKGRSLPFIQEMVMQILSQGFSGNNQYVQTQDKRTEVALWTMLIASLIFFDKCYGLIITSSNALAQEFFTKELFDNGGPFGVDLSEKCGKKLVQFSSEYDLFEAEQGLTDYNTIPVLSLSTYKTMLKMAEQNPEQQPVMKTIPWYKKMFVSKPPKPKMSPLKTAFFRTNLVVKVREESIAVETEPLQIGSIQYVGLESL